MDSQGVTRPVSQPGGGLFAKLKAAPPWVWISIILGAGVLVVSWMIYRNQATANGTNPAGQGTVPADGTGQPLWSTADTSGMQTGNVQDLLNLLAYLQSTQTPNPPDVAPPGATTPPPAATPPPVATSPTLKNPPILAPGPSGGVTGTSTSTSTVASVVSQIKTSVTSVLASVKPTVQQPKVTLENPVQVVNHSAVAAARVAAVDLRLGG